jgi:hypothetical protein
MTGQGDTYIKIVDKETWDWIFSPWAPPTLNCSNYNDNTCPNAVLVRMRKDDPDADAFITRGTWENDRALLVQPVYGDLFFSVSDAMNYAMKHKFNIVESWEGCIY